MDDEVKDILKDIADGLEEHQSVEQDEHIVKIELQEPAGRKEDSEKMHQEMKGWFDGVVNAVKALKLSVAAPQVHVPAPIVNVPAPKVTVNTPDTIKVSEPTWLESMIRGITKPIIEALDKVKLIWPKEAKDAIPVRISDGEKFIEAFTRAGETIITGGGGSSTPTIKSTSNSQVRAVAVVNPDGSDVLVSGLSLPSFDYVAMVLSPNTTETYTFKTGGAGGTIVATVVVVYTDSTRADISTVTKT